MKKYLSLFTVLIIASSCVTPIEREYTTQSNNVEFTVDVPKEMVVNRLISMMIDQNYNLTSQTANNLTFERELTTGEEFQVALTIGNSYSDNSRIGSYNLIDTPKGIRVIWKGYYSARMIGGQVNTDQIDDNATFNRNMAGFMRIKEELESSYNSNK
jgi:hypothetical protein|tara:strand:+ start:240 stop:710 length:471 start_codon:yes stop_codon:yes gene_type:complete